MLMEGLGVWEVLLSVRRYVRVRKRGKVLGEEDEDEDEDDDDDDEGKVAEDKRRGSW